MEQCFQKNQIIRQDSQFTRTCTKISSCKDYNNNFQIYDQGQIRSSSQQNGQTPKLQQQMPLINGQEFNNNNSYYNYNNNNISSFSPYNIMSSTSVRAKDKDNNNTSLEQSKERQSSQIMSKFQMFQTYQSAISSKRNSIGGGRVNWMSFQNKNNHRSSANSMTSQEQMMLPKDIQREGITIQLQGHSVSGQKQNPESSSATTINNSLSRQQLADETKTPTSFDTLNIQQPFSVATTYSQPQQRNPSNINSYFPATFTGRYKQISLKNFQKNPQKISTFNDIRYEQSQKLQGSEFTPLNREEQTPKYQKYLQNQNFAYKNNLSIPQQRELSKEEYPNSPKGANTPQSFTNIQTFNDAYQSNKSLTDKLSPQLKSSIVLDQKRLSVNDNIMSSESTTMNRILQQQQQQQHHRSLDNQENRQSIANKSDSKQIKKNNSHIQEEFNTITTFNKSSPKISFKKAQIFQTKQEVKTKEIKVYDDNLQMQRRTSRGKNDYELIQLPFYRKRVVVVTDSNADSRSIRMTTNDRNATDTSLSQKQKTIEQQQQQLPMDQFLKCSEFISSSTRNQQPNQQALHSQFYSPLNIDFKKNLQEKQINTLLHKQRESHIQRGVNLNKIKQAFNSAQSDTIMGLISPENRYQTNRYSKHYQTFMISKK